MINSDKFLKSTCVSFEKLCFNERSSEYEECRMEDRMDPTQQLIVSLIFYFLFYCSVECSVQSTNGQTCKWIPNGLFTYITLQWRTQCPDKMIINQWSILLHPGMYLMSSGITEQRRLLKIRKFYTKILTAPVQTVLAQFE